jgi:PelA/Pel-15E family pectate lyase
MKKHSLASLCVGALLAGTVTALAQSGSAEKFLSKPPDWFRSEEGRKITTDILSWQSPTGSWPKNQDNTRKRYSGDPAKIQGTFDNGATTGELRFLARAFTATKDTVCRDAALKTIDLLLKAQYPTGGWPQYYPPPAKTYHRHITFNDNSMVRILETLRRVASEPDFAFVDSSRRMAATKAFDRGIACILRCQIRIDGNLAVWCAQHDEVTLVPRPARTYELASFSGAESAGILHLLMSLESPSPEVRQAIKAGAEWFDKMKITGIRQTRDANGKKLVPDPAAPPLWARFYDLKTGRPMFVDRDGIPKASLMDIGPERRNGYGWYGTWGEQVAKGYAQWCKQWP